MITHRESLVQALSDVETGALVGVSTLVVSRRWWDALSSDEQRAYQLRAERSGIALRADSVISPRLVEARGDEAGPPLSTEQPT